MDLGHENFRCELLLLRERDVNSGDNCLLDFRSGEAVARGS